MLFRGVDTPQDFVPRGLIPRRTTLKLEYLREFEPEFEKVLGYELGAHMGSIHEKKTRGQKSRATVPLIQSWINMTC
jgi:hypothetical protein